MISRITILLLLLLLLLLLQQMIEITKDSHHPIPLEKPGLCAGPHQPQRPAGCLGPCRTVAPGAGGAGDVDLEAEGRSVGTKPGTLHVAVINQPYGYMDIHIYIYTYIYIYPYIYYISIHRCYDIIYKHVYIHMVQKTPVLVMMGILGNSSADRIFRLSAGKRVFFSLWSTNKTLEHHQFEQGVGLMSQSLGKLGICFTSANQMSVGDDAIPFFS